MSPPFRLSHSVPFILLSMWVAGCSEPGPLLGSDPDARRGNRGAPVADELEVWDTRAWLSMDHPLGRGWLDPANVTHASGALHLTLPAGGYDGAEIRSESRVRYRSVETRMRTPNAPGSISAFFLYEFVLRRNDEIDIEIFNDGSRQILVTTWVAGSQTNSAQHTLPFDPSAGLHDYRIEWSRGHVRFLADGLAIQEWTSGVPSDGMYVMANVWWPVWLDGPVPAGPVTLDIDRLVY